MEEPYLDFGNKTNFEFYKVRQKAIRWLKPKYGHVPECQSDGVTGLTCDHLHCPRSSDERETEYLSPCIKVSGSLLGPGPGSVSELPRALQSAVSMARPGLHTLNTNSHILNTEERDQERSVTNIDNIH